MLARLLFLAAVVALTGKTVFAQTIVISPGPDEVAVTIYRDPNRAFWQAPNLDWLDGYALISETRRISLPAGESTIRFERVAGGIIPQSAIIAGFPEDIVERNRDAYLLSPATLLDASLGRRVHLRRVSSATGAVREQEALVRSGAGGAVVLQTAEGFEALRCTGLEETLIHDGVPPGLAPQPTLSVRARAREPATATITLSYLASGFDWQANYVAALSRDSRHIDLFAWLTLASTDETSFANAGTQAVAGVLNREEYQRQPREGPPLRLSCWPQGSTSQIPLEQWQRGGRLPFAPPMADAETIIVTGSRVAVSSLEAMSPVTAVSAQQENLGDLKLYRIPIPVTVAANSQKQVALLQRPRVRVSFVYRRRLDPTNYDEEPQAVARFLVTRNREREGLGLPLPGGRVALFAAGADRPILIGEGALTDRAVGDDVEIAFGPATGIFSRVELLQDMPQSSEYRLIVTNDSPRPVRFEAELDIDESNLRTRRRLSTRDGRPLWRARVPATGSAVLRYRILKEPEA